MTTLSSCTSHLEHHHFCPEILETFLESLFVQFDFLENLRSNFGRDRSESLIMSNLSHRVYQALIQVKKGERSRSAQE